MIFEIILMLSLIILFYQDLQSRKVYWILFPTIFITGFWLKNHTSGINEFPFFIVINIGLLSFILLLMLTYFLFIPGKSSKEIFSMIGLGDILFFYSITPFFEPDLFIIFFSLSLFLILMICSVFIFQNRSFPIPLAGFQACLLLILLVLRKTGMPVLELIQKLML